MISSVSVNDSYFCNPVLGGFEESRLVEAYNRPLICLSLLINKGSLIKGLCLCLPSLFTLSSFHMYTLGPPSGCVHLMAWGGGNSDSPPLHPEQPRPAVLTVMQLAPTEVLPLRTELPHPIHPPCTYAPAETLVCVFWNKRRGRLVV